jgi:hypothetical protein
LSLVMVSGSGVVQTPLSHAYSTLSSNQRQSRVSLPFKARRKLIFEFAYCVCLKSNDLIPNTFGDF